jgi:effector-binding domain-containing protein
LIAEHLRRMEEQLAHTRDAVASLRALVEDGPAPATIEQVRRDLGDTAAGPPAGVFEHDLFEQDAGEGTLYIPVAAVKATSGRARRLELPATDLAIAVHEGAHTDIDLTYGRLGTYVAERGLDAGAPLHERYLVSRLDTPDAARWRTEIGWPIRVAG